MSSVSIGQAAGVGAVQVEPVTSKQGVLELVEFPFKLYQGDPNWVPPLIEERRDFLDPNKNPFFDHARCQLFLARRNGAKLPVTALVDQFYSEIQSMGGGRWDTSSLIARLER